jgi:hypothetical protein
MNHDSLAWPIIPSDVFHVLPLSNAREKKNKKKTISPPPIRIKKKNGKPSHFVSVSLYCALPVFALIVLVPLFPADYSAVSLVCVSKRSPRKKKKHFGIHIEISQMLFSNPIRHAIGQRKI